MGRTDGWGSASSPPLLKPAMSPQSSGFLGKEVDVTYVQEDGTTALTSTLQLEMDSNQNVWRKNPLADDEVTALTIRVIDHLVGAGIYVNRRTGLDNTALHAAAAWSSAAVVLFGARGRPQSHKQRLGLRSAS